MSKMRMFVYRCTKEDIAQAAGGPMGSPTVVLWDVLFSNATKAKKYSEVDFAKTSETKIGWTRDRKGNYSSGDLGAYMYTVEKERVL